MTHSAPKSNEHPHTELQHRSPGEVSQADAQYAASLALRNAADALHLMTERRVQASAVDCARRNAATSAAIAGEARERRTDIRPLVRLIRDCEPGTVIILDPRPYRTGRP